MPDLAMCSGDGCPQRAECYRHRAVPTPHRQPYVSPPVRPDGSCHLFLKLRKGDVLIDLPVQPLPVAKVLP